MIGSIVQTGRLTGNERVRETRGAKNTLFGDARLDVVVDDAGLGVGSVRIEARLASVGQIGISLAGSRVNETIVQLN